MRVTRWLDGELYSITVTRVRRVATAPQATKEAPPALFVKAVEELKKSVEEPKKGYRLPYSECQIPIPPVSLFKRVETARLTPRTFKNRKAKAIKEERRDHAARTALQREQTERLRIQTMFAEPQAVPLPPRRDPVVVAPIQRRPEPVNTVVLRAVPIPAQPVPTRQATRVAQVTEDTAVVQRIWTQLRAKWNTPSDSNGCVLRKMPWTLQCDFMPPMRRQDQNSTRMNLSHPDERLKGNMKPQALHQDIRELWKVVGNKFRNSPPDDVLVLACTCGPCNRQDSHPWFKSGAELFQMETPGGEHTGGNFRTRW